MYTVDDFDWGEFVRCEGQIMFIQDSSGDDHPGMLGLQTKDAPKVYDHDWNTCFPEVKYYSVENADVALRMGSCYEDGAGVEADLSKAKEYFEIAKDAIAKRMKQGKQFGDWVHSLKEKRMIVKSLITMVLPIV